MKKEAAKYPGEDQPQLLEAAQSWRFPYWDWALKKPIPDCPGLVDYTVPIAVLQKQVKIRRPTSQGLEDFPNAFYQFTMPGNITMGDTSLQEPGKDCPKGLRELKDLRITPSITHDDNERPYVVYVRISFSRAM